VDVVVKLYYEKIPDSGKRSTIKFQESMERAMEQVCKDHYFEFCKHLPVCDLGLGPNFLKEIHTHYDMHFKSKMFMKKLQMLTYSYVSPDQKLA
jgi:hypothetical protein